MPVYAETTGTSIEVDDFNEGFTIKVAVPYVEVIPVFTDGTQPAEPVTPPGGFDSGFDSGFEGGGGTS